MEKYELVHPTKMMEDLGSINAEWAGLMFGFDLLAPFR